MSTIDKQRERAVKRAYPCPHCGTKQTYAERPYPHTCKSCGKRIGWFSIVGTVRYGWEPIRQGSRGRE